jgi:hypothetical protein
MYIQHAQNKYDIVDMYKTQDNGYSARNSGPSPPNWAERLYDSAWAERLYDSASADGGGYSKMIGLDFSTNTIVIRLYRSSTITFSNVYNMQFRFYV